MPKVGIEPTLGMTLTDFESGACDTLRLTAYSGG